MVPASLLRKVALFLEDCTYQPTVAGGLAASLRRCGVGRTKKSAAPARARRESKRKAHREEMAEIRAACFKRAEHATGFTRCEACGNTGINGYVLDHWESGVGRRRANQSVETCWVLCQGCDFARTRNAPSAEFWNRQREKFCRDWRYPFTPHIVHAPVEARR